MKILHLLSKQIREGKCKKEGFHRSKFSYRVCKRFLEYEEDEEVKGESLVYDCSNREKYSDLIFNNEFKNRLTNALRFFEENLNKSILLLRKGVYPYEYKVSSGKFL